MSAADISRRLGDVSERTVRYRIERLRMNQVIDIKAVVNPRALGLTVRADVFVQVAPGRVGEVAESMARLEQVSYVAVSTGTSDLSVQVYARDNDELYQFVTERLDRMPGVVRTSMVLVPRVVKDVYDWHIPDSHFAGPRRAGRGVGTAWQSRDAGGGAR